MPGHLFWGSIDFDYDLYEEKAYDIVINAHTIQASAAELQQFLTHLKNPLLFQKFPLEGSFRHDFAALRITSWPDNFEVHGEIQGALNGIACPPLSG